MSRGCWPDPPSRSQVERSIPASMYGVRNFHNGDSRHVRWSGHLNDLGGCWVWRAQLSIIPFMCRPPDAAVRTTGGQSRGVRLFVHSGRSGGWALEADVGSPWKSIFRPPLRLGFSYRYYVFVPACLG